MEHAQPPPPPEMQVRKSISPRLKGGLKIAGVLGVVALLAALAVFVAITDRNVSVPISDLAFSDIKNQVGGMTSAQEKEYLNSLIGKRIIWNAWVEDVREYSFPKRYEVSIDLDPPDRLFSLSDIEFNLPKSIALALEEDQLIRFEGTITEVKHSAGSYDVDLKRVKLHPLEQ